MCVHVYIPTRTSHTYSSLTDIPLLFLLFPPPLFLYTISDPLKFEEISEKSRSSALSLLTDHDTGCRHTGHQPNSTWWDTLDDSKRRVPIAMLETTCFPVAADCMWRWSLCWLEFCCHLVCLRLLSVSCGDAGWLHSSQPGRAPATWPRRAHTQYDHSGPGNPVGECAMCLTNS